MSVPTIDGFDVSSLYEIEPPKETEKYIFQQVMVRVKNPKTSLEFYIKVLGFELIWHGDFPQYGFTGYFVAPKTNINNEVLRNKLKNKAMTDDEKFTLCMQTPGCVELTWNHGSENEQEAFVYNTGNKDTTGVAPQSDDTVVKGGFGHLGVSVPDVYEASQRLANMGVEFTKTPNGGGMKGLAFIKDPDGYLIEILPQGPFVVKEVDHAGVKII